MGAANQGHRIVFLGPPNSGKGTQAKVLAERLGIPAISTGEMLREAVESGAELGKRVEGIMARGELVNDELMAEVVKDRLAAGDTAGGFILDGYPRTSSQAETLAGILKEIERPLDAVVLIDAPEDILVQRALLRGREDDQEHIVRDRLRVYREKTAPLIDFYAKLGNLLRIDGDQGIDEVSQAIVVALEGP